MVKDRLWDVPLMQFGFVSLVDLKDGGVELSGVARHTNVCHNHWMRVEMVHVHASIAPSMKLPDARRAAR